jgi:hypothetical protein
MEEEEKRSLMEARGWRPRPSVNKIKAPKMPEHAKGKGPIENDMFVFRNFSYNSLTSS